jgi:hypothetical protein
VQIHSTKAKFGRMCAGLLLTTILFAACSAEATPVPVTQTPVSISATATYPYFPMFTLTPVPPTVTPSISPIPPLPGNIQRDRPQPIPSWLASVSPPADSVVPLIDFERICIRPTQTHFSDCPPPSLPSIEGCSSPLLSLFGRGERVHNYLFVAVNGIIPSELTWQDIIVPNSTHPGTAWPGLMMQREFCWEAETTTGLYEVVLHYPAETGGALHKWYFVVSR